MSRIGNAPILIPAGVTVESHDRKFVIVGPKGKLKLNVDPFIRVEVEGQNLIIKRKNDQKRI